MTRQSLIRLLLGMLIALTVGMTVSAQQAEPPTHELDEMTLLTADNTPLEAAFNEDVTTQFYAFRASEGDNVTVTMTQESDDSELDPYLLLLRSDGTLLAADDDSGDLFLSAAMRDVAIPADDTYFVIASSRTFIEGAANLVTDELPYTLTLTGNTSPTPDDSADTDSADVATLTAPQLTADESIQGELSQDRPVRFYVFEGTEGQSVDLSLVSEQFSTLLHLFNAAGERIEFDPSAITSFELPADGMYIVLATDLFFYEANLEDSFFTGGEFELTFLSDGS